jgi:hypothetical protein
VCSTPTLACILSGGIHGFGAARARAGARAMKRLSELSAEDHLTARAQVLIRAIGPTLDSEERRRRIRRSLDVPEPL